MMNELVPILIVPIVMLTIYRLFELFVRKSERLKIIEQATNLPELVKQLNLPILRWHAEDHNNNKNFVLRFGLLFIGIGTGLVLAFIIQNGLGEAFLPNSNVLFPACICLFGGFGLLISYFIEKKNN